MDAIDNYTSMTDDEVGRVVRAFIDRLISPSEDIIKHGREFEVQATRIGAERIDLALVEFLDDASPRRILYAAYKLLYRKSHRDSAVLALRRLLTSNIYEQAEPKIKALTLSVLSATDLIPEELRVVYENLMASPDREVRVKAAGVLGDSPESIRILRKELDASETGYVVVAAKALIRNKVAVKDAVLKIISLIGTADTVIATGLLTIILEARDVIDITGPYLLGLLKHPKTAPVLRTLIVSKISKLDYAETAKNDIERELLRALKSYNWEVMFVAAHVLIELGSVSPRILKAILPLFEHSDVEVRKVSYWLAAGAGKLSSEVIPSLLNRFAVEPELDTLIALGHAIELIGLKEYLDDASFVETHLHSLIEFVKKDEGFEFLKARVAVILQFGTLAIPELVRLGKENRLTSMTIASHLLATVGTIHPNEVIPTVIAEFLFHPEDRMRLLGASVFSNMGTSAERAVPQLVEMLESKKDVFVIEVLRALKAMGPSALPAAESVIPVLGSSLEVNAMRAEDVLLAMGPGVRPVLENAMKGCEEPIKRRLGTLLSRLKAKIVDVDSSVILGEFHWIENDDLLRLFVAVGTILEQQGPTSYRKLQELLEDQKKAGLFGSNISTFHRSIHIKLRTLEELLCSKDGPSLIIRTGDKRQKGGLTPEGLDVLRRARNYLAIVDKQGHGF